VSLSHPAQEAVRPICCGKETELIVRAGIVEVRALGPQMEKAFIHHINQELQLFGAAAERLLESLRRDSAPAAVVYRCASCGREHFRIDQI